MTAKTHLSHATTHVHTVQYTALCVYIYTVQYITITFPIPSPPTTQTLPSSPSPPSPGDPSPAAPDRSCTPSTPTPPQTLITLPHPLRLLLKPLRRPTSRNHRRDTVPVVDGLEREHLPLAACRAVDALHARHEPAPGHDVVLILAVTVGRAHADADAPYGLGQRARARGVEVHDDGREGVRGRRAARRGHLSGQGDEGVGGSGEPFFCSSKSSSSLFDIYIYIYYIRYGIYAARWRLTTKYSPTSWTHPGGSTRAACPTGRYRGSSARGRAAT